MCPNIKVKTKYGRKPMLLIIFDHKIQSEYLFLCSRYEKQAFIYAFFQPSEAECHDEALHAFDPSGERL